MHAEMGIFLLKFQINTDQLSMSILLKKIDLCFGRQVLGVVICSTD